MQRPVASVTNTPAGRASPSDSIDGPPRRSPARARSREERSLRPGIGVQSLPGALARDDTRVARRPSSSRCGVGGIRLADTLRMIHGPFPTRTRLADHIQQLAAFAPTAFPVLSLYLDLVPNRHQHEGDIAFVRAALAERVASLHPQAPERASLERDVARIETHLRDDVSPSASGLAIFACSGDGFFDAVQLDTRLDRRALYVGAVPHLYPLVRLEDEYPRYAAVMLEAHHARIYVFGLDTTAREAATDGRSCSIGEARGGGSCAVDAEQCVVPRLHPR